MRKTLSPLIIAAVFWPILNQAEAAVTESLEYRADIPTIAAGFGQSIAIDGNRTLIARAATMQSATPTDRPMCSIRSRASNCGSSPLATRSPTNGSAIPSD